MYFVNPSYLPSTYRRFQPTRRNNEARKSQATMARIGKQLLSDAKASVVASEKDGSNTGLQGRALLTLLVKSNMSTRLSDRLSDEDVLARTYPKVTVSLSFILIFLIQRFQRSSLPAMKQLGITYYILICVS